MRRERILLSLFFLLHFGSIAIFVAPSRPDSLSMLPAAVGEPLERASAAVVETAWPVAGRYLSLTATRQHWTLFAPGPSRWFSSIDVVAWYPADSGEGTEWTTDTIRLQGAREDPLPHILKKRHYRFQYNLGHEEWEAVGRPVFAQALCERLTDDRGRKPDGLSMSAEWERIRVPWKESREEEIYRQFLGGYTCPGYEGPEETPLRERPHGRSPGEPGGESRDADTGGGR